MLPPWTIEQKDRLYDFLASLGISKSMVRDEELMITSFTHKSYAADYNGDYVFNERLEFLGDAILGSIVARRLYLLYPDRPESDLTLFKIALVRAETFALVAQEIGLDKVIFLGKGEEKNAWRQKETILCDCLEAFLWYVALDIGVDTVEKIVGKYILIKLDWQTELSVKSYKSHFQELLQKLYKITPRYEETEGKDPQTHEVIYTSRVYKDDVLLGEGTGSNKKKAQEQAAKCAYEKLAENVD